jgi:alanyl-tRNA synthetase
VRYEKRSGSMASIPTEKLYWKQPEQAAFEADGPQLSELDGKPSIVLDRTLFYPEGGGQLGDIGTLTIGASALRVVDTQIDDSGTIHHVLAERSVIDAGGSVRGTIDRDRRRDHTTQHTAQHALSRALADVARAETVSSRLGATTCTIDVTRASLRDADLHRAEDLVNALVGSDVEIRALYPDPSELPNLPLRKQPKVAPGEVIRIIDIDGFDMTPCGGTHCSRTGQIGQLRVVGVEKYKGMSRITFHAGLRALSDARTKHDLLTTVATDLTCSILDVPTAVGKLRTELKGTRTQLDAARAELADLIARAALADLPEGTTPIVIPLLRSTDDIASLRLLAGKLASSPRVIALTATVDPSTGELLVVLQRGPFTTIDCGAFIQAQAKSRDGRGGGRPERAEGRFPKGTSLDELATALSEI